MSSGWLDALEEETAHLEPAAIEQELESQEATELECAGGASSSTFATGIRQPSARGRGRGRPPGSRLFHQKRKAAMAAAAAEDADSASRGSAEREELPLEKARRVLKEKRIAAAKEKQNLPAVADGRLQGFGEMQRMAAVGSMLQCNLIAVAAKSHVPEEAISGGDDVLDAHLQGRLLTTPWKALSKVFSAAASTVASKARSAGAAVVELGSWLWTSMCTSLQPLYDAEMQPSGARPRLRPVMYVMRLRYDETPSKLRVVTSGKHGTLVLPNQQHRAQAASAAMARNAELLATWQEGKRGDAGSQPVQVSQLVEMSTQSKIIQCEHFVGMLFQDYLSGQYFWLWGELPTWLMAVDRCTGENTRRCIMDVVEAAPEMRRIWSPFELKLRVSVTDRFGANGRAEAGLTEDGFLPEFPFSHVACDVHRLSTSTGNAAMLLQDDVAGVLNTGLACGSLGSTRRLREILATIFEEELEVCFGPAPAGPETETPSATLDLLLPSNAPSRAQRKQNNIRKFILRRFLMLG